MKESQLYIHFFKNNAIYFLTPVLISFVFGIVYIMHEPTLYQASALFEYSNSKMSISEMQIEINQAVEYMRSSVIQDTLQLHDVSSLDIYKRGDLSVEMDISSTNKLSLIQDERAASNYVTQKFSLQQVGIWSVSQTQKSYVLILLIALFIGSVIGLALSLIRSYLRNY